MKLLGNYKSVLNNRRFLQIWLAQGISNFGDAIAKIALMILITNRTNSVAAVSSIIAVQMLPFILVGPFAGVLVDRLNRKSLMIICDIARAVLIGFIAYAPYLWMIYVLSALVGTCSCFFNPALLSLTPEVVGEDQFMSAQGLTISTLNIMTMIGPAIGGLLIGYMGIELAFLIDSASFLLSATIISFVPLPKREKVIRKKSYMVDFRAGLSFIAKSAQLQFLLISLGVMILLVGGFGALLIDYVNNVLNSTPAVYGFVQSLIASGLLISSLTIGYYNNRIQHRGSLIFNAVLATGICSCVFFFKLGIVALYIWAFIVGCTDGAIDIPLSSLLIDFTPADKRGRVLSVYSSVIKICSIAGLATVGLIAKNIGTANTIGAMGLAMIVIGICVRFLPTYNSINNRQHELSNENHRTNTGLS